MVRYVIEKLRLTEISGVDNPAQPGALVTIMKRLKGDQTMPKTVAELEKELAGADFEERVAHLRKSLRVSDEVARARAAARWPEAYRDRTTPEAVKKFDAAVHEIRRRDGCSRSVAMSRAAAENPDLLQAYRA